MSDPLPWLLEPQDPGVRYLALRDLLDLPADNHELLAARQVAHTQGPIATILDKMHPEDKEEVIGLHERISAAISANDPDELKKATADLRELLFFVEGH